MYYRMYYRWNPLLNRWEFCDMNGVWLGSNIFYHFDSKQDIYNYYSSADYDPRIIFYTYNSTWCMLTMENEDAK